MAERLAKWSVAGGTVISHMHYGLGAQVPSGEIGVVVRDRIADGPVAPKIWPAVGSMITAVVEGYAGNRYAGSQLRLSTRPSHLEEARRRMVSAESGGCVEPDLPASGS